MLPAATTIQLGPNLGQRGDTRAKQVIGVVVAGFRSSFDRSGDGRFPGAGGAAG